MPERRGDGDLDLALEDVEGGGAEVALAADDLARSEGALHHGAAVQVEERARHPLEDVELLQLRGRHLLAGRQVHVHDLLVGQRAGGARHHALAATDAGGGGHRHVGVEGDAGRVALAGASDDEVLLDLRAAADAAVAQDARGVIDVDEQRGLVVAARRGPRAEAGRGHAAGGAEALQLAVVGGLLPLARRGVIAQQQLGQRAAGALHAVGGRRHHHPVLARPHAGGGQHARVLHLHRAHAAHAHRRLVLRVAERGNVDAEPPGGVEDRGAGRHRGLAPVDRQLHRVPRAHHTPIEQTLAGHR